MNDDVDPEDGRGPRLRDLAGDGGLGELIDREIARETAPLHRKIEALHEAAVDRELRLRARAAVEADIMAEADRRASPRRLRSVEEA